MTPLFSGALVAIADWAYAGRDAAGAPEEWCPDDHIVVTRRGAWELKIAGDARVADPVTATFWNRDAQYRVRHPVAGGDQCTIFRLTESGTRALREVSASRGAGLRFGGPLLEHTEERKLVRARA